MHVRRSAGDIERRRAHWKHKLERDQRQFDAEAQAKAAERAALFTSLDEKIR
jgi:hypothetical protein